ncbi:MAG: hypothetical protein WCJ37_10600 [Syntrophus sp. (in: bacteria)]
MNSAEKIYEHIKALPEPAVLEILVCRIHYNEDRPVRIGCTAF